MASTSRLRTALNDGLLVLPEGAGNIVRPKVDFDIGALADHPLTISTTFAPDAELWSGSGYDVAQNLSPASFTVINVPRSKAFAKALVAQAATQSDLIIVDGDKTDGVDSLFKACRKVLGDVPSVTKNHGRMFWFERTDAFRDWMSEGPKVGAHGFFTTAGIFSDGAIDKGSALLLEKLPKDLSAKIADLGAGWGYLSAGILDRTGVESLTLVEAEEMALDCAKLNITDDRASFHWADARTFEPPEKFDAAVMNPPFHTGREGDPSLGQDFIRSAARMLKPNGDLWMVANRHLPYEATINECFQKVAPVEGSAGFKIVKASRPKG
ncbi:16S rRNA m(2)G 1207 methyltransferase [Cognatiyoonia sediminum]|uniref:16S rRNA m(2)G 1207 methyltransferase n=1 Tax=Cognatiyoonia sediminum TaxID=1508389 RepID=A0A1M5PPM5_9RHOB|nr:class I SAM-dependent methyltransferase [Cognatiyoonia sediminum]SHH03722.1 16S rRNA m(2)G 1207 methyltransferase [Cognatiyoonia sediminum]